MGRVKSEETYKRQSFNEAACHGIYLSRRSSVFANEKRLKFDKIFGFFVCLCISPRNPPTWSDILHLNSASGIMIIFTENVHFQMINSSPQRTHLLHE